MTKTKLYEVAAFPLTGPAVYKALLVKYSFLIAYSAGSVLVGVQPTIAQAAGRVYGLVWPSLLLIGAIAALVGVVRSRHTGHVRLEYAGTVALLAGMVGYFVAIAWIGIVGGHWSALPSALLPLVLSVFPFFRLRNILGKNKSTVPVFTGEVPYE